MITIISALSDAPLPVSADIPAHHRTVIQRLRARLRDPQFIARHRMRVQDFTRQCVLTFPILLLFLLQKSVKSLQSHLQEFLAWLAPGLEFEPVTSGAVTHARAKLKASAFKALNQADLLPAYYGATEWVRRWHGHRLLGIDSSLFRLPDSQEIGDHFGWKEVANQHGDTGTRYPEGRLSVLYDVLNGMGVEAQLVSSRIGEVALSRQQLRHVQPNDVVLNDCGFTGYVQLALIRRCQAHFIARCSPGSFGAAQELFRRNRANQSLTVWLFAPPDQKAECRRLGLPLKMKVRLVSVRLPSGELEVLATSLVAVDRYPTADFKEAYHGRWGHEGYHLMLKGRLDLENFSGRTVAAVLQDVHAAVFLCNLESLLTQPVQSAWTERPITTVRPSEEGATEERSSVQVNHAVGYHALKTWVLELLYSEVPVEVVLRQLRRLLAGSPVVVRADRVGPPRCKKRSYHRSYHYQRRVKKVVF